MYAVFEDGGRQYKVSQGDVVLVDIREMPEGQSQLTFDKVLFIGDGDSSRIGQPFVERATVTGKVLGPLKMPKVRGVKYARRKGLYKRWGHRQPMMKVSIDAINA